jgi:hypothetical protein
MTGPLFSTLLAGVVASTLGPAFGAILYVAIHGL